jgi:hypothetical protein
VFIIFVYLSLPVHEVTDKNLSVNHCRQIEDNLPEMLSGTVEGNFVSVFSLKTYSVESYNGVEIHLDVIFTTTLERGVLLT